MTTPGLTLSKGVSRCLILPECGGGLGRWSVGDQDMVRRATPSAIAAKDPMGLSSFPLVPYSNRIGNGQFAWGQQTFALAKNFAPEPHAIHGVGWVRPWRVDAAEEDRATLSLSHVADTHWPWAFEAQQVITLDDHSLSLTLSVRNLADSAVPLAFGHHPYFDAAGAWLCFKAARVWMSGTDALPATPVPPCGSFDFSAPAAVQGRDVDNCYAGLSGSARIRWHGRPLAVEISSAPQLQAAVVYIPAGEDYFCFEPVPHINNALNLPGHAPAMPVIAPGASFETKIVFRAVPAE